ncbi:hypothetical protein [Neisseria elongata]|jgi:hypothetical protein|uniref:hypothetical protein n=1 Tax=Neisseria elongata TaxID=495 RepID=UPI000D3CA38A|nr:hypothetical protein [Neisseria elongata]DAJ83740.1 MAG TPA: hypothetical protein [Caudoviricetes sp.]DAY06897.1 MAG TPA: hypothetical protein [Caudoviricetes sp.]
MAKNNPEEEAVQKSLQDTPDNPPEQQQEAQGGQTEQQPEVQDNLPENQLEQQQNHPNTAPNEAETEKALAEQPNPPAQPVLVPVASGEAPVEGAEMVAVKTHNATRFYRCGLEFTREIRIVERSTMDEADWQRLLAEPNLTVQGVVLMTPEAAYDEDVPQ